MILGPVQQAILANRQAITKTANTDSARINLPTAPEHTNLPEQSIRLQRGLSDDEYPLCSLDPSLWRQTKPRVFDTVAEACDAPWTAEKLLHGDYARKALRSSARTRNVIPLPLSTTVAAIFLELRAMAARGIGQHYQLLWLRRQIRVS
jgi:hypothetical protein